MAHLRNCILCGSEYDYCPRCDKDRPAFYLKYCSENCKAISMIENRYSFNHLTQQEAADALSKLDLSSLEKFKDTDKEYIKNILSINEEKVEDIEPEPEEIEEIEPEKKVIVKSKPRRINKK